MISKLFILVFIYKVLYALCMHCAYCVRNTT